MSYNDECVKVVMFTYEGHSVAGGGHDGGHHVHKHSQGQQDRHLYNTIFRVKNKNNITFEL